MTEQTNETRMRSRIAWNTAPTTARTSNRNPRLGLSPSDNFASSIQRTSSNGRPHFRLPKVFQRTKKRSNHYHERTMTTPTKEERDPSPTDERRNPSTPMAGSTSDERWENFYSSINHSPPKNTNEKDFDETIEIANKLLKFCDDDERFKDKTFDDLEDSQKAILTFEIVRGLYDELMENSFGTSQNLVAQLLKKTWIRDSDQYQRVYSFVRPGGDEVRVESEAPNIGLSYLESYSLLNQDGATNIFLNKPGTKKPIYYIQHENSFVCTLIAAMLSMLYSAEDFDFDTLRPNLSRFIRNEITARLILNLVLTQVKGAPLKVVFDLLVQCFGAPDCDGIEKLQMFGDDEDMDINYRVLQKNLSQGRTVTCTMETFPGAADTTTTRFYEPISYYFEQAGVPRPDEGKRQYHALVIVGIRHVHGVGCVLLVQDSCEERPFFEVSLTLLMSMGIEQLEFYTVGKQWKFREDGEYKMTPQAVPHLVGSPMHFTRDGGVAIAPQMSKPLSDISDYFSPAPTNEAAIFV